MNDKICEECFAHYNGECRFNPPVVTDDEFGQFPAVEPYYWCVKFKRKKEETD